MGVGVAAAGIVAVAVAIKRRKILKVFQEVNATSPEFARTLSEIGVHRSFLVRRLIRTKVIVELEDGRCYFSEPNEHTDHRRRTRIIIAILIVGAIVMLTIWLRSGG